MKTKDLIAALQEADPSGEEQVAVGNYDIHFVDVEPAYYDGCLQVLQRDKRRNGYNICGVEFRSGGGKVVIHDLPARRAIYEEPDIPVTFDSAYAEKNYAEAVAKWRQEGRDIKTKLAASVVRAKKT